MRKDVKCSLSGRSFVNCGVVERLANPKPDDVILVKDMDETKVMLRSEFLELWRQNRDTGKNTDEV